MKTLLFVMCLLCIGCAPVKPTIASSPVVAPQPAPTVVVAPPTVEQHPIHQIGLWQDKSSVTEPFTTFITVNVPCDDSEFSLPPDNRSIVWFANFFTFTRNGYELRSDYVNCWSRMYAQIGDHFDRTLAIWLLDEPADVSYGVDPVNYNPNRYNDIIVTAASFIHADFPKMKVGLNYGHIPNGLVVPSQLDIVGLEAYDSDWQEKLTKLSSLTNAELWLLPRTFLDNGDSTDVEASNRLWEEFVYAQTNPRITTLYPFLWCCDDTTTGNKAFFTVSGPNMPLTHKQLETIGLQIKGSK